MGFRAKCKVLHSEWFDVKCSVPKELSDISTVHSGGDRNQFIDYNISDLPHRKLLHEMVMKTGLRLSPTTYF